MTIDTFMVLLAMPASLSRRHHVKLATRAWIVGFWYHR